MKAVVCVLIDDDQEEGEIFNFAAEELTTPIRFYRFSDGYSAVKQLGEGVIIPDFIFLDMHMPRMDGRECLSALRGISALGSVPIMVYSTGLSEMTMSEMAQLGATGFVAKTANIPELTRHLKQLVEAPTVVQV